MRLNGARPSMCSACTIARLTGDSVMRPSATEFSSWACSPTALFLATSGVLPYFLAGCSEAMPQLGREGVGELGRIGGITPRIGKPTGQRSSVFERRARGVIPL
ncbi:hypothetical protein [Nocardia sp. NPDC004260]